MLYFKKMFDGGKWGEGHYQVAPPFVQGKTNGELIEAKDNSYEFEIEI